MESISTHPAGAWSEQEDSAHLLHSPTAAAAPSHPHQQPPSSATKRKRPSPILTALPAPSNVVLSDLLASASSPLRESTSEPGARQQPSRSKKMLRVSDSNNDVNSGSPNVSSSAEEGEKSSEAIQHHPPPPSHQQHHAAPPHPAVTPRSSPPEFHVPTISAVCSPTPSPPAPLSISSTSDHLPAALLLSSAQHSTASSAYSTPLYSASASARAREGGFSSVSRGTVSGGQFTMATEGGGGGGGVGESPSWSASMEDTDMHAAGPSGANTPPSNVASPSATPRLCPTNGEDRGLLLGDRDEPRQFPLTVVPSSASSLSFLPSSRASARGISPSSSPAHSPTSTASHLRPAYDCPPLHLNTCSPLSVPAASPQLHSVPSATAMSTPRHQPHHPSSSHPPPRAPSSGSASVASAVSEPGSSPKAIHPRPHLLLNLPSTGSSPTNGRGPSPAASPARSPLPAGAWAKPQFLSRLSVSIPELSPGIASPVAAYVGGPAGTPVARPSPSQAARDRAGLVRDAAAVLTKAVAVKDGVVEQGENYAVSMKKGRRRNMEDYWMTSVIDFHPGVRSEEEEAAAMDGDAQTMDGASGVTIPSAIHLEQHVDSNVDMDSAAPHPTTGHLLHSTSTSSVNFFGICDGHGKNGALVAQLTSALLPSLLAEQLSRDGEELMREARNEEEERRAAPPVVSLSADDGFALSPALHSTRASMTAMSTSMTTASAAGTPASSSARMSDVMHSPLPRMSLPPVHQAAKRSILSVLSPQSQNEVTMQEAGGGGTTVAASRISPKSSPHASPSTAALIDTSDPATDDASALSEQPSDCLATLVSPSDSPLDAISAAVQAAHMEMDQRVMKGKYTGGTTCTTVLVRREEKSTREDGAAAPHTTLYISNLGDSRCVLSRSARAYSLTSDHKPDALRKDERERVERAGGRVVWISGWRVDGVLNISRAIGDAHLKDPVHPHLGRIVARPEMSLLRVTEEDEFVILASDGVWGRVENQKAVEIVRKVLMGVDDGGRGDAAVKSPQEEDECKAAAPSTSDSVIHEEDESTTNEDDQRMELPRHPSLTHEHSYVDPSPDAKSRPNPMNPIVHRASSAAVEEDSAVPGYDRVPSSETVLSLVTPRHRHVLSAGGGGLRTDGTMSTSVSQRTNITAGTAGTAEDASMTSRLQSPLTSPDARTTRTQASRVSSTQLTTPIGAMQMASPPAGAATSSRVAAASDPRASSTADAASSSAPSTRAVLDASRLGLATEALLQYAYEEANSMDNMSVCIVLLHGGR